LEPRVRLVGFAGNPCKEYCHARPAHEIVGLFFWQERTQAGAA
jgi:hypothetical protein